MHCWCVSDRSGAKSSRRYCGGAGAIAVAAALENLPEREGSGQQHEASLSATLHATVAKIYHVDRRRDGPAHSPVPKA